MEVSTDVDTSPEDRVGRTRERELLRYYRPGNHDGQDPVPTHLYNLDDGPGLKPTSPDITLTAFAQLVALRLNMSRAFITVIDRETQFQLSEATKTLNLVHSWKSEGEDDGLWIGCGSMDKKDGLCENTVAMPVIPGLPTVNFVPDLSKDSRFMDRPYVCGPPYWKVYVGVPLTTNRGINIGALCALDDQVRNEVSADQVLFLTTIAASIMRHLEMKREAEKSKKMGRMSQSLNAFVEGRSKFAPGNFDSVHMANQKTKRKGSDGSAKSPKNSGQSTNNEFQGEQVETAKFDRAEGIRNATARLPPSNPQTQASTIPFGHFNPNPAASVQGDSQDVSDQEVPWQDIKTEQQQTFTRAANLLRESLDLLSGGVAFLDTVSGVRGLEGDASTDLESLNDDESIIDVPSPLISFSRNQQHRSSATTTTRFDSVLQPHLDAMKAGVLGCSIDDSLPDDRGYDNEPEKFMSLGQRLFQQILRRYPRGKLWSFDEDGSLSSSEEEPVSPREKGRKESNKLQQNESKLNEVEANTLQCCFPRVRQLLFAPLWDSVHTRWYAGCFCWTTDPRQVFSTDSEVNYLVAFGNSIMAEVSRLATIAADQQKGDFIGSISHELRSPLHGILASAEFLAETECDGFQMSLIDTVASCGRNLLDTINHVLDFSKITFFERSWRKAQNAKSVNRGTLGNFRDKSMLSRSALSGAPPLLDVYAKTDVASICEEVVEGVSAGQAYQDTSKIEISDIAVLDRRKGKESGDVAWVKPIEIIIDINKADWTFVTQPGALRRVIMNIFGNALKYTERGVILVKLELQDVERVREGNTNSKVLVCSVQDTGRGISNHYLRTCLFTPFAQEDTLAPGTGLGLSIVRSIIDMLGGSIDIRSQVGRGTEVKMTIPMGRIRSSEPNTPTSTPSSIATPDRTPDNSIALLQGQRPGSSVLLYGFVPDGRSKLLVSDQGKVLQHYVSDWYGFDIVSTTDSRSVDIAIVDERNVAALHAEPISITSVIILCGNTPLYGDNEPFFSGIGVVEYMSKPFGPYKLAKVMHMCFDKVEKLQSDLETSKARLETPSVIPETLIPVEEFKILSFEGNDDEPPIIAQSNGIITASNPPIAQLAIESLAAGGKIFKAKTATPEFPFPLPERAEIPLEELTERDASKGDFKKSEINVVLASNLPMNSTIERTAIAGHSETVSTRDRSEAMNISCPPFNLSREKAVPKVLLVDDNKINLRLLQTFISKRKYQTVDFAENGYLAVQAAEAQKDGYDIIFMDISMPIMNGFEATRVIRKIEESRRGSDHQAGPGSLALIIALTGLASSRDQSEAFASGVDIFMTKPVSFKEIGKLLDNWEARKVDQGNVDAVE